MTIDRNTLPANLKENEMDFVCFENGLRSCISDCFDDRLDDLYTLIGINEGDVSPLQSVRLNSILTHFSGELTALAVELSAQNKRALPRCEEYDSILKVLHKMYDDFHTENDEQAKRFFDSKFTLGFGDVKAVICNGASSYEIVEGSLLRLLEETADCYGDGYDYSDPIVTLENGEAKLHFTEG